MVEYDYSEYDETAAPEAGDNSIGALRTLARAQKQAEARVAQLEEELSNAKEDLKQISEVKLPELMDELGIPTFQTKDGLKITIKETIRVSMGRSDEEKAAALDWLDAHGHGALIKRTVEVPFSRGKDSEAQNLATTLRSDGFRAVFERRVENPTLRSFVTEKLENGEEVPLDLFKVLRDRRAKVEI